MTIYWERCSICSRYHAVKQCVLYSDILVCPHCCVICPKRSTCPKPVWEIELREKKLVEAKKPVVQQKKRAEKVLLDLLSKLEAKE
ncbi:hypothetical protein J4526_02635 [Desulfurococcaceae archaeon MEX13E-LK6-19]|nr:hypothetical protein J4526_02635 [Desulfurococcaceae archaeon MEX13E-LK6-19]